MPGTKQLADLDLVSGLITVSWGESDGCLVLLHSFADYLLRCCCLLLSPNFPHGGKIPDGERASVGSASNPHE